MSYSSIVLDPKISSAEDLLKDVADVQKLRKMGITDFAVITYAMLLKGGATHEYALQDLLRGRTLDAEQVEFARSVLQRIAPNGPKPGLR